MGDKMKRPQDKIVEIAVKSSELLELVQWDLPLDQQIAKNMVIELKELLDELEKEIS